MNKFTTEELELMFELLVHHRACQDTKFNCKELTKKAYEADAAITQSCLEKLAAN